MIGVPSSHTASGFSLIVSVMPPAAGAVLLPVSPALVLAPASVVGASLLAAAPVVSLLLPLLLPHAAAISAVPASSATTLALLGVLLTYLTSWLCGSGGGSRRARRGSVACLVLPAPVRGRCRGNRPELRPAFDRSTSTRLTSPSTYRLMDALKVSTAVTDR